MGRKKQFKLDGSFNDKYFKINSKTDPKKLWVIFVDETRQKTNSNIIQIEENFYKKLNLKTFLNNYLKLFGKINFHLLNYFIIFLIIVFSQKI